MGLSEDMHQVEDDEYGKDDKNYEVHLGCLRAARHCVDR